MEEDHEAFGHCIISQLCFFFLLTESDKLIKQPNAAKGLEKYHNVQTKHPFACIAIILFKSIFDNTNTNKIKTEPKQTKKPTPQTFFIGLGMFQRCFETKLII